MNDQASIITPTDPTSSSDSIQTPPVQPDLPTGQPDLPPEPPKKSFFKRYFRPELIWPGSLRNKLGKAAAPLALLLIFAVLGGVAYGAVLVLNNSNKAETGNLAALAPIARFQVLSTTPTDGQKDVKDSSTITVNFNQPVSASKLKSSFILTPTVNGTIAQGSNDEQVVFTPNVPFKDSTAVTLMIDNDFQSQLGQKLSGDYTMTFNTHLPDDGVVFSSQSYFENLLSAQSNVDQALTLNVGSDVDPNGQIVVYHASLAPLLKSLEYQKLTDSLGFSYDNSTYDPVDTTGMQQLTTSSGLKDQATFKVKEAEGIYLVAALSKGQQVGWTWVVFNDNGTVLRQDDQRIILSAYNLTDNSNPSNATVTFYNLNNGVQQLGQSSLQSPGTFSFPYNQQVDAAVVTTGQDTMVVPVSIPNSLGDLRVKGDLSSTKKFYAITDKPSYAINDTIKLAGYVNLDNDAQYTTDPEGSIKLFVADQEDPTTPLQNLTATVGANGVFSGQFTLGSTFSAKQNLGIYAYQDAAGKTPVSVASFSVADSQSQNNINVAFTKSDYVASDKISATITATQSNGQPLANTSVTYNLYSKPYYENDMTSNLNSFGSVGDQLGAKDQTVQLNSSGQAVVNIDASQLKLITGGSQSVTLQASKKDSGGATADAGATAIVHQGNIILHFGPAKSFFDQNSQRFGRLYATDLSGKAQSGLPVNYQFVTYSYNQSTQKEDPTVLGTGSGTTDSNGFLQISKQLNTTDTVTIIASATDSSGNIVTASTITGANYGDTPVMAGADNLDYLDVSGSSGQVNVGDKVSLTINSPKDLTVLVSYERGRIYKYQTMHLNAGDNNYTLDVSSQLAPSFNLVFSYFIDGSYHTEGTAFVVNNPANHLNLTISPDQGSYKNGQTASISLSNSQGTTSNYIVAVESDSEFNLNTSFEPDMYPYYYASREYSTNSSSSLTGIGSGGGKCGGGGFDDSSTLTNNTGKTLYWNPNVASDSSGKATINVPMQTGKWHVVVYAMGKTAAVGNAQAVITAQ